MPIETARSSKRHELFRLPADLVNQISQFWSSDDFFEVAATSATLHTALGVPEKGSVAFQKMRPHPGYEQVAWLYGCADDGCRPWRITSEFSRKMALVVVEKSRNIIEALRNPAMESLDFIARLEVLRRRGTTNPWTQMTPLENLVRQDDFECNIYLLKLLMYHSLVKSHMKFTQSPYEVRLALVKHGGYQELFGTLIQTFPVYEQARLCDEVPALLKYMEDKVRFSHNFRRLFRSRLTARFEAASPPDVLSPPDRLLSLLLLSPPSFP